MRHLLAVGTKGGITEGVARTCNTFGVTNLLAKLCFALVRKKVMPLQNEALQGQRT